MTRLHVLLCILFAPCIFADLFSFKNPFGSVAVATFEEHKIIEENFGRDVRDTKKHEDQEKEAVVGTPKMYTGTSELIGKYEESPILEDKGRATSVADLNEKFAEEELQENRTSREIPKTGEIVKLHQDNDTSTHAPSTASIYTTLTGHKREMVSAQSQNDTTVHHLLEKHQDSNSTQKVVRSALIAEYKRHLSDRFHLPVLRETGDSHPSLAEGPSTGGACEKASTEIPKMVGKRDVEMLTAESSGVTSAEEIDSGISGQIDLESGVIESDNRNSAVTEEVNLPTELRFKRESKSSTTQKYTYDEDEYLIDEEDDGDTRKRESSKKKASKHWDHWGPWTQCSVSCGVGKVTRWRHCLGEGCAPGEKEAQIKSCTQPACL